MELTEDLKNEYLSNWASCTINPADASAVNDYVDKIMASQVLYESLESKTGVPWYVIAVIHGMESTFNFGTHLHNGDPLSDRTVREPKGRPEKWNPPSSWEDSAIDALDYDGATGIKSWDLPTIFWFLEGFNGWGYRIGAGQDTTPRNRSPYIYSKTNHYQKGKYVKDGSDGFDPNFVSEQVGCMAQLFALKSKVPLNFDNNEQPSLGVVGSVAAWQNILNGCGYYPALFITGDMDDATVAMTKKFQEGLNLPNKKGDVDLATWDAGVKHDKIPGWSDITPPIVKKKNPVPVELSLTTVGSVAAWQNILNGCGYPPLPITGNMDGATIEMTKRFQKDLALPETGVVDIDTWKAGVKHDKIPGWSEVTPPLFTLITIPSGTIAKHLHDFYNQRKNYDAVHKNVMSWFGTTKNACVAFVSSALRLSGYNVPKTNLNGGNISLWTPAFSKYLEDEKGWKRINDASLLEKGDIVFTVATGKFGTDVPDHVYVFAGWDNKVSQVAWVIDNQAFTHRRNINRSGGGFNFTPFDYFLRA